MIIYEDPLIQVSLPDKSLVSGQMEILPRTPANAFNEVPPEVVEHLFFTASYAATVLFETLGAQGTNIILNEQPVRLSVLARKVDDGFEHQWQPTQGDEQQLLDAMNKISDALPVDTSVGVLGDVEPNIRAAENPETVQKITEEEAKENYMIRQLHRIP